MDPICAVRVVRVVRRERIPWSEVVMEIVLRGVVEKGEVNLITWIVSSSLLTFGRAPRRQRDTVSGQSGGTLLVLHNPAWIESSAGDKGSQSIFGRS